MNKKLLAAAVAAAVVAAPAAFAEATIYGKFHASIDSNDFEAVDNEDNYEVNSRSSRVGLKGSEDLGGGLKAIYQLELSVNVDGGGSGQDGASSGLGGSSRNTFIGLSGDFGTFLVGRHDTPGKVAFYGAGNERLGDSVIDLSLSSGLARSRSSKAPIGVFHEYRANDAIAYVSPSFSGFTFIGAVIPGEDNDASDARDGIADHWSVGGIYKGNGLKASIGYTEYDIVNFDKEVLQVGASYTMNNFSIGAQWEDTDNNNLATEGEDYEAWAITGKATFGNNAVSLVYTMSEKEPEASGNDVETDGWGVAVEHNFSKRTKAYAAYASADIDNEAGDDEDDDVFSLGMIHNF